MGSLTLEAVDTSKIVFNERMAREMVTIAKAQATVTAGQVLAMKYSDGKYYKYDSTKTDGTEVPRRIYVGDDLDTTVGTDDFISAVARECEVVKSKIVGIADPTSALTQYNTDVALLEKAGIYLATTV